jgi:hypothetical protein
LEKILECHSSLHSYLGWCFTQSEGQMYEDMAAWGFTIRFTKVAVTGLWSHKDFDVPYEITRMQCRLMEMSQDPNSGKSWFSDLEDIAAVRIFLARLLQALGFAGTWSVPADSLDAFFQKAEMLIATFPKDTDHRARVIKLVAEALTQAVHYVGRRIQKFLNGPVDAPLVASMLESHCEVRVGFERLLVAEARGRELRLIVAASAGDVSFAKIVGSTDDETPTTVRKKKTKQSEKADTAVDKLKKKPKVDPKPKGDPKSDWEPAFSNASKVVVKKSSISVEGVVYSQKAQANADKGETPPERMGGKKGDKWCEGYTLAPKGRHPLSHCNHEGEAGHTADDHSLHVGPAMRNEVKQDFRQP